MMPSAAELPPLYGPGDYRPAWREIRSTRQFFTDWALVHPGRVRWQGEPPRSRLWDTPTGIRLAVQPAQKSAPWLVPDQPWEQPDGVRTAFAWVCTLRFEAGRYRCWYNAPYPDQALGYAESDDGWTWHKPALRIVPEVHGAPSNRLLYGGDYQYGAGVFVDPTAAAAERYKLVYSRAPLDAQGQVQRGVKGTVGGAVSPDGLSWRPLPAPIVDYWSDTQDVVTYDSTQERYVGYFRHWDLTQPSGRRGIARAETADFAHWPRPQLVLAPGPEDPPSDDLYSNGYTLYPGTDDVHLLFSTVYHRATDTLDVRLAASRDGVVWSWVSRAPVLTRGPVGAWDQARVYAGCGLVPLGPDRIAVPYAGFGRTHNDPGRHHDPTTGYAWAWWPRDRLVALEAPVRGECTTRRLVFAGDRLVLNYETGPAGEVRVELADQDGVAVPGRSFAEADALVGDDLARVVTWRGEANVGSWAGRPVYLRFRLRDARLYTFQFADG